MRGTIHLVTARDCLFLRPITRPVMDRTFYSGSPYGRKLKSVDIDEVVFAGRALVEEKPRTRAELGRLLAERWPDQDPGCLGYYPEARAALASAERAGRITSSELDRSNSRLNQLWAQLQVVELDEQLAFSAGELAEGYALRDLDAVHLATAFALRDESLVVATWDAELRSACLDAGLRVAPAA